jgi:hypothetical protein
MVFDAIQLITYTMTLFGRALCCRALVIVCFKIALDNYLLSAIISSVEGFASAIFYSYFNFLAINNAKIKRGQVTNEQNPTLIFRENTLEKSLQIFLYMNEIPFPCFAISSSCYCYDLNLLACVFILVLCYITSISFDSVTLVPAEVFTNGPNSFLL